ncbi:MAG: hypothetical protein SFV54_17540 [Bryobacteraceae bacterium]|nr:hypothetical protein [Bryobacteraceae bacterium]
MSGWNAVEDASNVKPCITKERYIQMKKLMTVLLGLSLLTGVATVTFAQEEKKAEETPKKKKKGGKKKSGEEKKTEEKK